MAKKNTQTSPTTHTLLPKSHGRREADELALERKSAKPRRAKSDGPRTQNIRSFDCPHDLGRAIDQRRAKLTEDLGKQPSGSAVIVGLLRKALNLPDPAIPDYLKD